MNKKKAIQLAIQRVRKEISDLALGGKYAAGLASESYSGGYRDALYDVQLVMNGVKPKRRDYWDDCPD